MFFHARAAWTYWLLVQPVLLLQLKKSMDGRLHVAVSFLFFFGEKAGWLVGYCRELINNISLCQAIRKYTLLEQQERLVSLYFYPWKLFPSFFLPHWFLLVDAVRKLKVRIYRKVLIARTGFVSDKRVEREKRGASHDHEHYTTMHW